MKVSGTFVLINPKAGERAVVSFSNRTAKMIYTARQGTVYIIGGRRYRKP